MAQRGDGLEATQGTAAMILMNQNYSKTELTQLLQISWMDVVSLLMTSHSGNSSLIFGDGGKEKKITTTIFLERKNALLTPMRIFWKGCVLSGTVPRCLASKDSMPKWETTLRRYPHPAVPCAQVAQQLRAEEALESSKGLSSSSVARIKFRSSCALQWRKTESQNNVSCNKELRTSPGCGPPQLRVCLHDGPWLPPTVAHAFCTVCPSIKGDNGAP